MTGALIILAALIVVGLILYINEYLEHKRDAAADPTVVDSKDRKPASGGDSLEAQEAEGNQDNQDGECCGMHITCERDSLLTALADKIEYYEDEELDRFAGRAADAYSPEEIDEFREVLLTLRPEEIAGWARSIQLRGITLPSDVCDELLMIVAEARAAKTKNQES
ncbi:MAG: phospholipase [Muribaculaceae bacterium]